MVACNEAVLDPSVPEDQQRQEEEQTFFNLNRILSQHFYKRYTGGCTSAYRRNTRAVIARMRFSIAVEHPGEWRHTVYRNGEVFRILRFRAEKNGNLVVPCAFSEPFLRCCLPLRELGL